MKPEIKDAWVAALRSGKYEQGRRTLRSIENKYCCLGVLCDLYVKANPSAVWKLAGTYYEIHSNGGVLPENVIAWAGVKNSVGGTFISPNESEPISFIDANDILMYNFNQIADLIEKYADQL